MADKSKIEWTDATWNPVRGCSRISEGCRHCYAEGVAARFSGPGQAYEGLARMTQDGPRWTGKVRIVAEHLEDPIRWRRPRRVFVNSMSDLFHEAIRNQEIAEVFDVMRRASHHTFQVLTKRAHRMLSWCSESKARSWALEGAHCLPNVWLGVSVEDQAAADVRIPALLATPAAVRFLSLEPLIGPVTIPRGWLDRLDWLIIGGESGNGARRFELDWARELLAAARSAGVAVFVKQLGAAASDPVNGIAGAALSVPPDAAALVSRRLKDRKGSDLEEWPADLRVREVPKTITPQEAGR